MDIVRVNFFFYRRLYYIHVCRMPHIWQTIIPHSFSTHFFLKRKRLLFRHHSRKLIVSIGICEERTDLKLSRSEWNSKRNSIE